MHLNEGKGTAAHINAMDDTNKRGKGKGRAPAFEMVVLGSGGGPLETDCSGSVQSFGLQYQQIADGR
jgi:hypothetical protein